MEAIFRKLLKYVPLAALVVFATYFPVFGQYAPANIILVLPQSSVNPAAGGEGRLTSPASAVAANYRDFGRVNLNESTASQTIELEFHAESTITAITASADFRISGGSCGEGRSYAPGDRCTVEAVFIPQGPGHRTGKITIAHTASERPFVIPAGGDAKGPAVSFIPAKISTLQTTLAGGAGLLYDPLGMAIDGGDNLYIADTGNNVIRYQDSSGNISIIAGGGSRLDHANYVGPAAGVALTFPISVAAAPQGVVYIADSDNNLIDALVPGDTLYSGIVGGNGSCAAGSCPLNASIGVPITLAANASDIFFSEGRGFFGPPVFTEAVLSGTQGQFALNALDEWASADGTASFPLAVDAQDNLYFQLSSDQATSLCEIGAINATSALSQPPTIAPWELSSLDVAGTQNCGFSGDGGLASGAEISSQIGEFAWDAAGNLYFTDTGNQRVRRIDAYDGIIRTVAGNGTQASTGDAGPATDAGLNTPVGVAVDSRGDVYSTSVVQNDDAVVRETGPDGILNFGYQQYPAPTPLPAKTVLVSNVGNAPLNFTRAAITSGNVDDFAIDPNTTSCDFSAPLPSGQSCYIGVLFTPVAPGAYSAVLGLLDNTVTGSNFVELSATTAAQVLLEPLSLGFGSQIIKTSSSPQTVTLYNTGATPYKITSVSVSAGYVETNTCGVPSNLPAPGTCTISVSFNPTVVGSQSGTLKVTTSVGSASIDLSGTGLPAPPRAALTPTSFNYGSIPVGSTSSAKSFTLENAGGTTLSNIGVQLKGANPTAFVLTNHCGTSLAAGASCLIDVAFKPTAAQAYSADIAVSAALVADATASLIGDGSSGTSAELTLSPTSANFGTVSIGSSSGSTQFTLTYSGVSSTTINAPGIGGANPGDFKIAENDCPESLSAANNSCTIYVNFTPQATGARTATLLVGNETLTLSATLTGTGAAGSEVITRVALESRSNPSHPGQAIVMESSVLSPSKPTPTGKVELREGSKVLAVAVLDKGIAILKLSGLGVGSHRIYAYYLGDKRHQPEKSAVISQVVEPSTSQLNVKSNSER